MGATVLLGLLLWAASLTWQTVQASVQFAIIADPQYSDKPSTIDRCYRSTPDKLKTAIASLNARRPAFLVILGDYIDGYTSADSARAVDDLLRMNAEVARFQGDVYMVMGNHDAASLNKDEWLANTPGRIKRKYYSFDVPPVHFVVLDGNYSANGKNYGRIEPWTWTDTWVHADQQAWLIDDLDKSGAAPTVVFIHQNIQDQSEYSLKNSAEIRRILQTHGNVTHVLQGHKHDGQYAQVGGIHYLTLPAMVNCPADGNNYALATITGSNLHIEGFGGTPSRDLPRRLSRGHFPRRDTLR